MLTSASVTRENLRKATRPQIMLLRYQSHHLLLLHFFAIPSLLSFQSFYLIGADQSSAAVTDSHGSLFSAVKSAEDEYACAMGTQPMTSFPVGSVGQCVYECRQNNNKRPAENSTAAVCIGLNVKQIIDQDRIVCELFDVRAAGYVVQTDCKYYANLQALGHIKPNYPVCPSSFTYIAGVNGCYKMALDNQAWNGAAQRCATLYSGAHLVFVNSDGEQQAVASILSSYTGSYCNGLAQRGSVTSAIGWWLGGQRIDPAQASTFYWKISQSVPVAPIAYNDYMLGEPNYGLGEESCLELHDAANYQWNDANCGWSQCFVCELDL